MPPRLQLSLDQNDGFGQSGQDVAGTIRITTDSPFQVLHLRVAFYGHAQVYGDGPETPLSNGIFDYLEDRQLINSGIRIARRPSLVEDAIPLAESSKDAMKRPLLAKHNKPLGNLHNNSTFTTLSNDSDTTKKPAKTVLDKETERLIRHIAIKEKAQDAIMHPELADLDYPKAHVYDLNSKQHKVRYRLSDPTKSRVLPGSFDHPHCPIRYYTIAIMLGKELDTGYHYMIYARHPIHYEPPMNVLATTFAGFLREYDRLWLGNDSILARLLNSSYRYRRHRHHHTGLLVKNYSNPSFISVTSSSDSLISINGGVLPSALTHWWYRLMQRHNWIRLDNAANNKKANHQKALDCTLELPRRAFCRGQPLPFTVHLTNGAGIPIAMVTIEMKLIRRIVMTCSMAETIDTTIEFESTCTFHHSDNTTSSPPIESPPSSIYSFPAATRDIRFDLSRIITLPPTCPTTLFPELTRDTFELVYDWVVKVKVLEKKPHGSRLADEQDELYDILSHNAPTVATTDYKTHCLEPPKMTIVIGNTETKT